MSAIILRASMRAQPGKEAEMKQWINDLVDRIQAKDPGTLAFGFYPEGDTYVVFEVYRDSEAAFGHLANVGELLQQIQNFGAPGDHQLEVYGTVSDKLRETYGQFNARFIPALRDI